MSKYTRNEKIQVAIVFLFAVMIFMALLSNAYTLAIIMGLAIMTAPWSICKVIDNYREYKEDRRRMR